MTITTGSFPKALWPGVKAFWGLKYKEHPSQYTELFEIVTSDKAYEELVEGIGMGLAPVKPQGTATLMQDMQQGVVNRFTNVAYGLGYQITREEMDDNRYETLVMDRAGRLAFSFRQTRETVGANFYNRAFTTTFADGVPLISTVHPTKDGTQSNRLSVDADLSEQALEDLTIQIRKATDSVGLKISLNPTTLHIAPDNEFVACRILKSVLQNDTANNAINALRAGGYFSSGYRVNNYFSSAKAWFVRTDTPAGMKWFDRIEPEFKNDNDFSTDNHMYKGYMRFVPGFADWRGVYGTAGV